MLPTRMTSLLNIHWNILKLYHIDPEPLFLQAGIDPELLSQPGIRCKVGQAEELWETMIKTIKDPCFGLKATKSWHPSDLGALGYAALASRTLEDTIERINRYQFAVLGEFIIKTKTTSTNYTVTIVDGVTPEHYSSDDATLAIILSICRVNYRTALHPKKITLRHHKPPCSAAYYELFGRQVSFDAPDSAMVFSIADIKKPLPSNNPRLTECSDEVLQGYLDSLDKEKFVEKTKIAILRHLPTGKATEERIAQDFHMSKRNFQRALKERNVTYRDILNNTRQILAKYYLENNQTSISEIAFMLGYSCSSTFSRAFASWTGISPKQFSHNGLHSEHQHA